VYTACHKHKWTVWSVGTAQTLFETVGVLPSRISFCETTTCYELPALPSPFSPQLLQRTYLLAADAGNGAPFINENYVWYVLQMPLLCIAYISF
jgi:hypothetical protein